MPISRPSLQTLITRIQGDIQGSVGATAPLLANSVLLILGRVMAASCSMLWGYLIWASQQLFPATAEASYLEAQAATYGIYRIPASFAAGEVELTGTNGTVIPMGTIFTASAGTSTIEYASAADETISAGNAVCTITATTAGSLGTLSVGQILQLLQPIAGVNSQGTVQSGGLLAGDDAQTDDSLRTALLTRIQNPPQGGSQADYIEWMQSCPSVAVVNCWCYPLYGGAGTVGITFTVAGGPVPSGGEVTAMQDYVNGLAPVTATVICFAPTLVTVAVSLTITPDTTALRTAVEASLSDYFANNGSPGTTLYLSQINEAIASVPGIVDHAMTVPNANVVLTDSEIAGLGTVTW